MKDFLDNYIKVDLLRDELTKSCVWISTTEDADQFVNNISAKIYNNAIFATSSLKSYCFSKLQSLGIANIINCNSCLERFCEDIQSGADINIFDNLNHCKNKNILDIILNKKGIFVC